ncbi:hypothetical protein H6G97_05085 [Nostoc flagelliforme FACHB-838]|uniref:Transposase n=1 Tax=Nostoc flagelliforme FACHB-838 TaxID=2692904 RepID=A0ABR8DK98_9NOSO|nr:hypothetical protein [Nostoc flagelliforme]MBD2528974.1 hypothetical protein [Nostoc flagelliforme FACHB-838]
MNKERPSRQECQELGPENNKQRRKSSRSIRREAAQIAFNRVTIGFLSCDAFKLYIGYFQKLILFCHFWKTIIEARFRKVDLIKIRGFIF